MKKTKLSKPARKKSILKKSKRILNKSKVRKVKFAPVEDNITLPPLRQSFPFENITYK